MEKLFDSELKVMEPLWADGAQTAGALAKRLGDSCGWNRNTTYTVIKKLIDKGAVGGMWLWFAKSWQPTQCWTRSCASARAVSQ